MSLNKKSKPIRCKNCIFVREDRSLREKFWVAYECGHCEGPYYKSLLNVDKQGNKQDKITWIGCGYAERSLVK